MKKLILFIFLFASSYCFAQEEAFTVRVHDKTHLQTKAEYSKKALFPIKDKSIKRINLNLYLGCPDSGCSTWDYSISVILRTIKNTDTINYQLGRMITPYGGAYNMGENTKKWNQLWNWDITNYLPLMKDSVEIIVKYEGYQDGFLATTDFEFIEDKNKKSNNVIDTKNIHFGYFPYGNIEKPIDAYVTPKEITMPKGAKKVYARVTISGHGADTTNAAAEFHKKDFYYIVNGERIATQAIWKDDCGCNTIQPQGGTWIYNRAGWCPGTAVNEFLYDLTPYIKGNKAVVDIDFEYYKTPQIEQPGYQVAHDIFFLASEIKLEAMKKKEVMKVNELPIQFILSYKTNNDGSRNKACIINTNNGDRVYERTQLENNKEYNDKIELTSGTYKFLFTDSDCDGLSWWANKEQGNGYVYIYNKDKTKLLEAFDSDFGCKIDYNFLVKEGIEKANHSDYKLVMIPNAKTFIFAVFFPKDIQEEIVLEVKNRKTNEIITKNTYPKANSFQILYDYSTLTKGGYEVTLKTANWSETRVFGVRD